MIITTRLARPTAPGLATAVLRHAVRLIRRGAVIVVVVSAGMSAIVVGQHRQLFADGFDVASFDALAANPAIRIMFGQPVGLDDPGGFTVWRTGMPLAVLVSVWAMLTVLRVTRGDEETGRWELLLAGRYRLGRLVGLHTGVVAAATVAVGVAVTWAMIVAGADPRGSAIYGGALALVGVTASVWGALAGQLSGDRRRAATIGAAGIGAGLLVRMVADGVDGLAWLHWWTPFGLLGLTEPFAAGRLAPLGVLTLAAVTFGVAAALACRWRDLHAGLLRVGDRHRARTVLLRSLSRFAVRRALGSVLAWATAVWLYFFLVGLLASSVTVFLAENRVFAELAARAGFGSLSTVTGYVASLFALLAVPLGLYAASRIAATGADEEARRWTLVFGAPVTRRRWYLVEGLAALAGTVVLAAGAGVATWLGAVTVGVDVSLGAAVAGALNVVSVAWLSLGAALLALGWAPSLVLPAGAIPAAGGFLLQVLAESLHWPGWVSSLSPYDHLNAVPYEDVDWTGAAAMILVAAALAGFGLLGFTRRDLRG